MRSSIIARRRGGFDRRLIPRADVSRNNDRSTRKICVRIVVLSQQVKAEAVAKASSRSETLIEYRRVYEEAHAAGVAAIGSLRASDRELGNVGWGWVRIRPANKGFGRWLLREGLGGTAYGGGVQVSPPTIGVTNMDPQMRYAHAFAEVVERAGVLEPGGCCWADGRLDGDF